MATRPRCHPRLRRRPPRVRSHVHRRHPRSTTAENIATDEDDTGAPLPPRHLYTTDADVARGYRPAPGVGDYTLVKPNGKPGMVMEVYELEMISED